MVAVWARSSGRSESRALFGRGPHRFWKVREILRAGVPGSDGDQERHGVAGLPAGEQVQDQTYEQHRLAGARFTENEETARGNLLPISRSNWCQIRQGR